MKAAVIGAGRISRQHLACLQTLDAVEIAAVCDLSAVMAEAAADRFGVPRHFTDHRRMLDEVKPDIVHITTPPSSHYAIATDVLDAGAHTIIEKPAAVSLPEITAMLQRANGKNKIIVEDYNYLFNSQIQQILDLIANGSFGTVAHVDVTIALPIAAPDSVFADPNAPSEFLRLPGGAIADFLPHLASLVHAFTGPHKRVQTSWQKRQASHALPYDEFRALVDGERATATLAMSANAQPDTFSVKVFGSKMTAAANLFETRLTIDRLRGGPKPFVPVLNGLEEAKRVRRAAYGGLWRKLSGGPGAYEGLWELVRRTYDSLSSGGTPPVTADQIAAVNRLVFDMAAGASAQ